MTSSQNQSINSVQSKFGFFGTMDFAALEGTKNAIATIDADTSILETESSFAKDLAETEGGLNTNGTESLSNGKPTGILAEEFSLGISAAQNEQNALEAQAQGSMISGALTLGLSGAGLIVGIGSSGYDLYSDRWGNSEIKNVSDFSKALHDNSLTESPEENVASEENVANITPGDSTKIDQRIAKWKGSDQKEGDFSDWGVENEDTLNKQAIAKLQNDENKDELIAIQKAADKRIEDLKEKRSNRNSQNFNTMSQCIQQFTQAGSSIANSKAETAQAGDQCTSKEDTVAQEVYKNSEQTLENEQAATNQRISTLQTEITDTIRNIVTSA